MADRIPARLSAAEGRKFAFTVGAAFLILSALLWWRERQAVAIALGAIGSSLALLGLTVPTRLGPLNGAWMGLAHLISKVTTPIFMGVVFFITITPISLLMRLFGKVPLRTKAGAVTYWHVRDRGATGSDLTRQF